MENELELKWRRIQQAMRQEEADGCLLTMNMNLYYVSGQVFNGYFYLPAEGRPYWFVKRLTIPETNQVHVIRKPEQIPDFNQVGFPWRLNVKLVTHPEGILAQFTTGQPVAAEYSA